MALTTEELQQAAQYMIDNQTVSVADIPTAESIDGGATTIPIVQDDGTLRKVSINALEGIADNSMTKEEVSEAIGEVENENENEQQL